MRVLNAVLTAALLALPAASPAYAQETSGRAASLERITPENSVLVYVDYVTGLDNLITTIPPKIFRNNVAAFAKLSPLFKMPTAVFGEENDYYGTFLPEIKALVDAGAPRFPRSQVSGYTPEFAAWLKSTGRKIVIIGGISIDNCTQLTALDLLREGYTVYVVTDVSGSNNLLAERTAIDRLIQADAVPVGWLNAMTELGQDFASPYGKGMMEIVGAHWPAATTGELGDTTPDGRGLQFPGK